MKPLEIAGWVLFAIEALLVTLLFVQKNMGDDAAGRGMATGFAIVLAPIVLLAGGLMLWGQRGGPAAAYYTGLFIVSIPLLWAGFNFVTGRFNQLDRARGRAMYGRFENSALTGLARAIDRGDQAEVATLLGRGGVDFTARDRRGRTILGHAITRAIGSEGNAAQVECVRALVSAGAPVVDGIVAPERTSAEPEGHLTLITVIGSAGERARAVLEILLAAGLSPDGVDMDGRPVIFSTYLDLAELEILARHGVNLDAKDPRTDRLGWSALMSAVAMSEWEMARFFLDHGVDPDHRAADRSSLAEVLDQSDDPDRVKEFRRLLAARSDSSASR